MTRKRRSWLLILGISAITLVLLYFGISKDNGKLEGRIMDETEDAVSVETFQTDIVEHEDLLSEDSNWGFIDRVAIEKIGNGGIVYRIVKKNIYAGQLQVHLTAYFADEEHRHCVFAYLEVQSENSLNVKITPIVFRVTEQEEMESRYDLLFVRYVINIEKTSLSQRAQEGIRGIKKGGESLFTESDSAFKGMDELLFEAHGNSP